MQKIPTVFKRGFGPDVDYPATREVRRGCEWVLNGQASAYGKLDGTCVGIFGGDLYRRRTIEVDVPVSHFDSWEGFVRAIRHNGFTSRNSFYDAPDTWMPAQRLPRQNLKWPGWVKVDFDDPQHKWIVRAYRNTEPGFDGTYEAIGPNIQGNPHALNNHILKSHGSTYIGMGFESFEDVRDTARAYGQFEGLVFSRGDYQFAKIKRSDFGFEWPTGVTLEL